MNYLQLVYLLGCCSCFYWTKDEHVQFEATRTIYNVGDTVTLTCYVRSDWLTVSFERNNSELGICSTITNRCHPAADIRDGYGNYELKLEKSRPTLVIKNVTIDEDGADFTCQWTSYTDTTSFAVTEIPPPTRQTEKHVQFEATRTRYNVGDTVTMTCYVKSSWITVLFGRMYSDLGNCSTKMNGCFSTADIRDGYGNYELKLEKSRPMLVIKNVTIDEDGADFTCQWTSYTDTTSFAVTDIAVTLDIAVTTPSMSEENMTDSSMVLVSVIVVVVVLVIEIVRIAIVRQPVLYRRIVKEFIDWLGRRRHEHVQVPINTDTVRTCDTGQELQTNTHTFSEDTEEKISSRSPYCDVNYDHQKHPDRQMEELLPNRRNNDSPHNDSPQSNSDRE